MPETKREFCPRARCDQLIVKQVSDETLVYDLARHKAHCLNPTAAFVWERCDGRTSVEQISRFLEEVFETGDGEELVGLALDRLARARLLDPAVTSAPAAGLSRRQLVRKLGRSAIVPLVTTVVVTTAAQAQTLVSPADCFFDVASNQGRCCTNRRSCRRFGSIGLCIGPGC